MFRAFLAIFLIVMTLAGGGGAATAQEAANTAHAAPSAYVLTKNGTPDYTAWSALADRVERALETGRASDTVLRELRAELVDWREIFVKAQGENSVRINTLKTQIASLGPKPETDGVEPAVLTERRDELTRLLNEAEAPVRAAEEAHSRATALIQEIDSLMRARQTDQLLKLGPTPINPVLWPRAISDLTASINGIASEVETNLGSDAQRKDFLEDLPLTLVLLVAALLLLLRGRHWVMRMGAALRSRRKGPARGVVGFIVSIGQVIAPLLGTLALVEVLNLVGVLGLRGQVIADALPTVAVLVFGALWLGNRVFGVEGAGGSVMELPSPVARAEARLNLALLGALLALRLVLVRLAEQEGYAPATLAVWMFPVLLAAGVLLIRLGRLMRLHTRMVARDDEAGSFRQRTLGMISTVTTVIGFAGPVAAAVGYLSLAQQMLIPWVLTLGLLAVLDVLHRFFISIYATIFNCDEESAQQSLIPVLGSFVTGLIALPVFALIWGARTTDLTEIWTTFTAGFQLGDARVTPGTFLTFAVVFAVGYVATRFVQSMLKTSILPKTRLDIGGQNAISAGVGYVGIFLAALIAITSAGLDLSSVAIVAGALSVGIGFGLQNIVSNFVSGIILLIERPISEGDWIEVGGQMGYVRDISVRSTRVETFDRTDVILPNSDLISGVVTNFTRGNLIGRIILPVGVAYGTDTRRVEEVLLEIAEAHPMVTVDPAPSVLFKSFGADALEFEIRAILSDVNYSLSVKSDLNHEIARRFAEEGFEIPFAQRDLWIRNPEALHAPTTRQGGAMGQGGAMPGAAERDLSQARPVAPTVEDMQSDGDEGEGDV